MRKEVSLMLVASLLFFLFGIAGRADAVPTYNATIGCLGNTFACGGPVAQTLNSTTPVFFDVQIPGAPQPPQLRAIAGASYGELKGMSLASLLTFLTPDSKSASGSSSFRLDDLVLSGPSSTLIPLSVNLVYSGSFMADGGTLLPGTFANSRVDIAGSLIVPNIDAVSFSGSISAASSNGVPSLSRTGVFNSFPGSTDTLFNTASGSGSDLFTSQAVMALVGAPFTLELRLDTSALASSTVFGLPATALMDFAHTFGLPTTGPVFNVPAGYTVNSLSGLIVNNQFVTSQPQPTPVPEPSTMLLLGSGLAGLVLARKRLKG